MKIFFASFVMIFLKSTQQLNVVGYHYKWIMPVSFLMAAAEIVIIIEIVNDPNILTWLFMGLGAGLGAMLGMYVHRRWVK